MSSKHLTNESPTVVEVQEAIADYLTEHSSCELEVIGCQCGALTMSNYTNKNTIVFMGSNASFIQPTMAAVNCNCNHCANNWGVETDEDS